MSQDERRVCPRILTEFSLVIHDEQGKLVDDRALAHDVSEKGFKVESNGVLQKGQTLRFELHLADRPLSGRGRVAWIERTDLALWAGVEFRSLPWSDRRRLRRLTRPGEIRWSIILDKLFAAALSISAVLLIVGALSSGLWRSVLWDLAPKAMATLALGWALRELLRRRG